MTHPVEDLTAYLDGALSSEERTRVAEHLARCGACRTEHDRLAGTLAALSRLPPPPLPSPAFEQRFYARLAAQKAEARRGLADRLGLRWAGAWRWLAPGVAGVVAAAAVMIYAGTRHRADDEFLASHLDLFESYEEVVSLGAIDAPEDVQVVAHLHELRGKR